MQYYRWDPRLLSLPNVPDSGRQFRMDGSGFGLALLLDDILGFDRVRFASLEQRFTAIFTQFRSIKLVAEPAYRAPDDIARPVPMLTAAEGKGIYFELEQGGDLVAAAQASDGTLLVLAYLAILYSPRPPRMLLIEEPENGIHPKRLQDVLTILKELVAEQSHTQVVLTTHSPYVVDLFQPEQVSLCTRAQDGSVRVRRLSESSIVERQQAVFSLGEIWASEGDDVLARPGARLRGRPEMRILVVSEGPNELGGALAALVERLSSATHEFDHEKVSSSAIHVHAGKGPRLVKRAIQWMLKARKDGYDGLVLVIDHDGDDDRIGHLNQAQGHAGISDVPRTLGVAVKAFDAWMLADEKALTQILGEQIDCQPSPEDNPAPKETCQALVAESNNFGGLTELYSALAPKSDWTSSKSGAREDLPPSPSESGRLARRQRTPLKRHTRRRVDTPRRTTYPCYVVEMSSGYPSMSCRKYPCRPIPRRSSLAAAAPAPWSAG